MYWQTAGKIVQSIKQSIYLSIYTSIYLSHTYSQRLQFAGDQLSLSPHESFMVAFLKDSR